MISQMTSCRTWSESTPQTGELKGAHFWELQKGQNSKAGTALNKILFRIWYLCWNLTKLKPFESDDTGREARGRTARVRRVWPLLPARVCRDAGLRASAVADTIPEAARKTGEELAVPVCADIHALAAHDDVQIIHIATPRGRRAAFSP
jgi:hypothetical protein